MQKLALTFVLASAALAIGSISIPTRPVTGDHAKMLAMACCDDPPPPCYPEAPPCDEKSNPPGGENLKSRR
jgi:hypothetical protein